MTMGVEKKGLAPSNPKEGRPKAKGGILITAT